MQTRLILLATLTGMAGTGCAEPVDPIGAAEHGRHADARVLIEALAGSDPASRARAATAMGRIQHASYAAALVEATEQDDPTVVEAAWFALGQLGLLQGSEPPEIAVSHAEMAVEHPAPKIVALAVEALGKLAPPGAAARIVPLLTHESREVREQSSHALLRLRFVPTWRGETDDPPPLPGDAVRALADALGDPSDAVRRAAAHALSRYGQGDAAEALAARRDDADGWTRMFAVRGFGRSENPGPAEDIAWGIDDPDPHVRAETVMSLARLERPDLIPPALDGDDDLHVRTAVAGALGGTADAAALERLEALERDPSPSVRSAAIGALARRLGVDYLGRLEAHRSGAPWTTRVAVVGAVASIGEPALGLLNESLTDPDGRVRTAALDAARPFLDHPAVLERVHAALDSDDLAERATASNLIAEADQPDRLERLTRVFDRSQGVDWVEVREGIIVAVSEMEGAVELLQRAASSDDAPSVRSKARAALEARGLTPPDGDAAVDASLPVAIVSFDDDPLVVLETSKGTIEILTFPAEAPVHVSNFIKLVGEGFYDGLIWHRVVPNFVIQGGDPLGSGWGGPGYTLPDEINRQRYEPGTVGMPKAGKDTGGCQIFITHTPTPHLDGNYTVFGRVTSGLEIVDRIEVGDTIDRAYIRD